MREVTRDEQFPQEPEELPVAGNGPSESELVMIALLMRNYDLLLALVSHFDPARADEIYEAHEKGGHFNPQIFIPKFGEEDE